MSRRIALRIGPLAAASLAAACSHYQPAPLDLARYPADLVARRLPARPDGAPWSGADLLSAAIACNPGVADARARYRTAQAAARTARVRPPLTLTLTAEYADESPRWGYSGALDIPLDNGTRRRARLTTSDLTALQAFYDYGEAIWTVHSAIEKARATLAVSDRQLSLASRAASLRSERAARLTRRVEAGEDSRAVSLLAQTDAAAAERRLADLQGQQTQARLDLAKAVCVEAPQLGAIAVAAPASGFDPAVLPQWRIEAASSRRDVLRAVVDYDLAEQALRLEVGRQYPEVRLSPGYFWDHGVSKIPSSLILVLPPADLNRAAIAQAQAKRTEAGLALEAVQAEVLAGVDQAAAALEAAGAQAARIETRDLPIARRAAQGARASAQAGETDSTDQLAAEASEAETELALVEAQRTAALASVTLEDALRRPLDAAQAQVIAQGLKAAGDQP